MAGHRLRPAGRGRRPAQPVSRPTSSHGSSPPSSPCCRWPPRPMACTARPAGAGERSPCCRCSASPGARPGPTVAWHVAVAAARRSRRSASPSASPSAARCGRSVADALPMRYATPSAWSLVTGAAAGLLAPLPSSSPRPVRRTAPRRAGHAPEGRVSRRERSPQAPPWSSPLTWIAVLAQVLARLAGHVVGVAVVAASPRQSWSSPQWSIRRWVHHRDTRAAIAERVLAAAITVIVAGTLFAAIVLAVGGRPSIDATDAVRACLVAARRDRPPARHAGPADRPMGPSHRARPRGPARASCWTSSASAWPARPRSTRRCASSWRRSARRAPPTPPRCGWSRAASSHLRHAIPACEADAVPVDAAAPRRSPVPESVVAGGRLVVPRAARRPGRPRAGRAVHGPGRAARRARRPPPPTRRRLRRRRRRGSRPRRAARRGRPAQRRARRGAAAHRPTNCRTATPTSSGPGRASSPSPTTSDGGSSGTSTTAPNRS